MSSSRETPCITITVVYGYVSMVRRNVLPHPATLKCEVVDFSETLEHFYHTAHHFMFQKTVAVKILVLARESKFFRRCFSVDTLKPKI